MSAIDAIKDFVSANHSRFSTNHKRIEPNAVGWVRDFGGAFEYLFTSAGFREALKGFDFNLEVSDLQLNGTLPTVGKEGKPSRLIKINGLVLRIYSITFEKVNGKVEQKLASPISEKQELKETLLVLHELLSAVCLHIEKVTAAL